MLNFQPACLKQHHYYFSLHFDQNLFEVLLMDHLSVNNFLGCVMDLLSSRIYCWQQGDRKFSWTISIGAFHPLVVAHLLCHSFSDVYKLCNLHLSHQMLQIFDSGVTEIDESKWIMSLNTENIHHNKARAIHWIVSFCCNLLLRRKAIAFYYDFGCLCHATIKPSDEIVTFNKKTSS